MTGTVAAALCLTPALGMLAERLYDEGEIRRLRAEAMDGRAREAMTDRGWSNVEGDARGAAERLRDKSGVEILHASEPFAVDSHPAALSGQPPTASQIEIVSKVVAGELERYPRSFIEAASLRRVLLCRSLREGGKPIPSMPNYVSTLLLDVGAPVDFTRRLIHHEVYHFADYADDHSLSHDARWESFNDPFFVYGDGGRFMRQSGASDLAHDLPGFLTRYATAAVEEDKAEVFSFLMVAPAEVAARSERDPILRRKVGEMKRRVAAMSPEMNDRFWEREL